MALFHVALLAGISYFFSDAVTTAGLLHLAWKASGAGLLAVWAANRARSPDGWLLAAIMATGATADVLIDVRGIAAGGTLFLIGHLGAIVLYTRNPASGRTRWALVTLTAVAVALVAWLLPAARALAAGVAVYAAVLGTALGCAVLSRFPRRQVAFGTALFVFSDLLIFAGLGPLADSAIPDLLVWPTYFAAQALIAFGVVRTLERM